MKRFAILFCLIVLRSACLVTAQDFAPLANSMVEVKSVLSKFSENTPEFTSVFHFQVLDAQSVPQMQMMMELMMTKSDMRADCLVATMPQIPSEQREFMKSLQMDRIVLITRTDLKKMYLTFPGLRVFQEFPINDSTLAETSSRAKNVSLQKTVVNQETVNGHPCTKTLVVATETNRAPEKAILWFASDLKEFPVRMAMRKNNLLEVIEFKNVQLTTPSPTLFEIPTNYTRLENTAEVFRIATERFQARGGKLPKSLKDGKSNE